MTAYIWTVMSICALLLFKRIMEMDEDNIPETMVWMLCFLVFIPIFGAALKWW